jgi:cardiolipin synthase
LSGLNLPNFLTLCRIVAIPIFLILLEEQRYTDALVVFVAAGITDALDGAIARLTHTKTTLGAYLDPAADKALLVSSFIALGFMHVVPRWLVVIAISRDVVLVVGYFLLFTLTQQTMAVRPSVSGKLSTFLQLLSVTLVLVSLAWPGAVRPPLAQTVFVVTGAVTAFAGIQYMYRGLAWFQGADAGHASDAGQRRVS